MATPRPACLALYSAGVDPHRAAEALLDALPGCRADRRRLARLLAALTRPGLVLGLSVAGRHRVVGLGRLAADRPAGPDARSVFEIASLTKVFSASLLAVLAREGRLDPTAPLAGQFAGLAGTPRVLTALALATHTAGLPPHPPGARRGALLRYHDPYARLGERQLLAAARLARPGGQFAYSNLGYGLLGWVLARAAGLGSFGAALRHHLTLPLGLLDTRPDLTAEQVGRLATPHGPLGGQGPVTGFGGLLGAGGLHSSAADLLHFLDAHLAARPDAPGLPGALADTQPVRVRPRGLPPGVGGMALGWMASAPGGRPWRWHEGTARGTRSLIGFEPGGELGLVVLSNRGLDLLGDAAAPARLMLELLRG